MSASTFAWYRARLWPHPSVHEGPLRGIFLALQQRDHGSSPPNSAALTGDLHRAPMTGLSRRRLLQRAGTGALAFAWPGLEWLPAWSQERPALVPGLPAGVYDTAILDALPGKQPLIKLSYRPPNYETPVPYFKTAITPNDAFFVRYHLADIPDQIDANSWRLQVAGEAAATPFELT